MRLSVKGLAVAGAALWGGSVFFVMLARGLWTGYGEVFLAVLASIYPGFPAEGGVLGLLVGTLYAAVDGAVAGALLAWLYNLTVSREGVPAETAGG